MSILDIRNWSERRTQYEWAGFIPGLAMPEMQLG